MALLQRKAAIVAAQQRHSSTAASNLAETSLQPPAAAIAATAATAATMQNRPLGAAQTQNPAEQLRGLENSNGEMGSAVSELGPRRALERASAEALSAETRRVRCQLGAHDARSLYSILGRKSHDCIGLTLVLF